MFRPSLCERLYVLTDPVLCVMVLLCKKCFTYSYPNYTDFSHLFNMGLFSSPFYLLTLIKTGPRVSLAHHPLFGTIHTSHIIIESTDYPNLKESN